MKILVVGGGGREHAIIKKIKENKMTKNMYYNFSIIMRQCLCYAVDREILDDNPFSRVFVDGKRVFRKTTKKPIRRSIAVLLSFHTPLRGARQAILKSPLTDVMELVT